MIGLLAERSMVYGLVAALCFGAGWKVNGWRLGEGIADDKANSVVAVRQVEHAQQYIADIEGGKGDAELEEARRAADAARANAAGLRAEAGRIATRLATCNAGTAGERQARKESAQLFAELLAEVESAGRAMAATADAAGGRGSTCERIYDGVKATTAQP